MLNLPTKWSQVEKLGNNRKILYGKYLSEPRVLFVGAYLIRILFRSRRVHISEKTLGFLPEGHFEVEPAFGERREETLRIAGIKTYFISKVLKPVRAL